MKTTFLAAAIVLGAIFNHADAQVKQHAKNQHQRIKHGVKNGELTKKETRNLAQDQREIRKDVRAAKADGVVTRGERKDIKQDQRQQSRKIARKKHNRRDRN